MNRALAIREKSLGAEHPKLAYTLTILAELQKARGRYAEAGSLYQRTLSILEKALGDEHAEVAAAIHSLATLLRVQGRLAEAEPLYKRALAINERALGPTHTQVASDLDGLATVYVEQRRYAEAKPLYERALAIIQRSLGEEHVSTTYVLHGLARWHARQGQYADAETFFRRSLAIREKVRGPEHADVAESLFGLAEMYHEQGHDDRVEPLVDRTIRILDRARVSPDIEYKCYKLRAELGWKAGRRGEAVADLKHALDLAEQLRGRSSGTEHERAQFFGRFAPAFEQMVAWQFELGDVGETLSAIERARARSLLDDMHASGVDLDASRPALELEQLRRRQAQLASQVATLERKLSTAQQEAERRRLERELAAAREDLYEHYRDRRSSSPVYRNLLAVGNQPLRLSQLQRVLLPDGVLLLSYLLGEKGSYLLSIDSQGSKLVSLTVEAGPAAALGIEPGPLTADRLAAVLIKDNQQGVLPRLGNVKAADLPLEQLAALWQVLVLGELRDAIKKLLELRSELAGLSLAMPKRGQEAEHRRKLAELSGQEQELARQVHQAAGRPDHDNPWIEVAAVREALSADAVLVDIARFRPYIFELKGVKPAGSLRGM